MKDQRFDEIVKNKIENRKPSNVSKAQIDGVMSKLESNNKTFFKRLSLRNFSIFFTGLSFLLGVFFILSQYNVTVSLKHVTSTNEPKNINKLKENQQSVENNLIELSHEEKFSQKSSIQINTEIIEDNLAQNIKRSKKESIISSEANFQNIKLNKNFIQNNSINNTENYTRSTQAQTNDQDKLKNETSNIQNIINTDVLLAEVMEEPYQDNIRNNWSNRYIDFVLIKNIPLSKIISSNTNLLDNIPLSFLRLEPLARASNPKFSLGISTSLAENFKSFGVISTYDLSKHITVSSGLKTRINREIEYENEEAYSMANKTTFAEFYNVKNTSAEIKDIEIIKHNFEIPISLQYNKSLYKNFHAIGSIGLGFKIAENHFVSYEKVNSNRKQEFSKLVKFNDYLDFNLGLGFEKRINNFRFQLMSQYSFNKDKIISNRKHGHDAMYMDFRAFYNFSRRM